MAESDLTTVRLTADAEERLGIVTAPLTLTWRSPRQRFPGELVVPPGKSLVVAAPVAGVVILSPEGSAPPPGREVRAGELLYWLMPGAMADGSVLAASDRINLAKVRADELTALADAAGRVRQAEVELAAARAKLERATVLQRENAGSQKGFDEAATGQQLAEAALASAREQFDTLQEALSNLEAGGARAIPIEAPITGQVRAVHVAAGQVLPAGAPLCEVTALDPLWVRVSVYAGELPALEVRGAAWIRNWADNSAAAGREVRRVAAPETADPRTATIDLYFELANPDMEFRPGQRVVVELPMAGTRESLVVPKAAVLFDSMGGSWIYVNTAPQTYARRRVAVREFVGDLAVIERGPQAGANVVTDGAAELFGTEFGAGK